MSSTSLQSKEVIEVSESGMKYRGVRIVHIVGDTVVLSIFVLAGMAEHRTFAQVLGIARNLVIFVGAWAVFSWITGLYRKEAASKAVSARLVATWLTSIASGVLVRAVLVGRVTNRSQFIFWVVATTLTGIGLFGWRLAYVAFRRVFEAAETKV